MISGWVFGHSLIVRLAYNEIKGEKLKLLRFPYQVETVLVSTSSPSILQYICALQVLVSVGRMPPQRKVQRLHAGGYRHYILHNSNAFSINMLPLIVHIELALLLCIRLKYRVSTPTNILLERFGAPTFKRLTISTPITLAP